MASIGNHCLLLLLFTLFSSTPSLARENQFFNKVSSTTKNDLITYAGQPQNNKPQQEPNFLLDKENGHGLYGHDSGQLHPSETTTTVGSDVTFSNHAFKPESKQPLHKYLPRNYNPVAYVTEPEVLSESDNNPQGGEEEGSNYRKYPTTTKNRHVDNYYYNGGSTFNSGGGALSRRENNFIQGGGNDPQGMSDTRSLENGKYFYDINNEKYSSNHPYENLKVANERNEYDDKSYYVSGENGYELNGGQASVTIKILK